VNGFAQRQSAFTVVGGLDAVAGILQGNARHASNALLIVDQDNAPVAVLRHMFSPESSLGEKGFDHCERRAWAVGRQRPLPKPLAACYEYLKRNLRMKTVLSAMRQRFAFAFGRTMRPFDD
jgi:hypothetical protein